MSKDQSKPYNYSQSGYTASTNGMQLFLKYQLKIFSLLSLNLSIEPFYTYGSRGVHDFTGALLSGNVWYYSDISNVKLYFYGAEVDTNLSFQFYENLSLIVGYNFTYTKIRYENEKYFQATYYNGTLGYINVSPPFHSNIDHIKNYYIGLSAKF